MIIDNKENYRKRVIDTQVERYLWNVQRSIQKTGWCICCANNSVEILSAEEKNMKEYISQYY